MPGERVAILARTTYNLVNLDAAKSQDFVLVKTQDVRGFREGTLLVRVHAYTIAQADAKFEVRARTTAPSQEDPLRDYLSSSADLASITINNTLTAPTLLKAGLGSNFGSFLRVYLRGTQGAVWSTLSVTVSVELVLKE